MEDLTVPGVLDSLDPIGQYIVQASAAAGLERRPAYRLRLAVDEVVTNIIIHGYDEAGGAGDVRLSAQIDDHNLTVVVDDTAIPFDLRVHEVKDHRDTPLEERPIGGLGVFLALEGVDEFRYEFVDNRNRNIFIMHRPAATSADGG